MPIESMEMDEAEVPSGFRLRGRQPEWLEQIKSDLKTRSRILVVAPGGTGKTCLMSSLAHHYWTKHGIRTLALENRDRLTEQTADRMRNESGLEVNIEKGDEFASPHAPIVVACVQSLSKVSRLTGFSDTHFGLILVDECHLCLSPSWQRIVRYFHYGAESLATGWFVPTDGTYAPKSSVVGFTASPDLGGRRNLGEVFQGPKPSVNYSYLDAIEEGLLVGIREINVPVKIDTRKFRRKQSAEGASFNTQDQNAAMLPIIRELAAQIPKYAPGKKGICFVPSVEIAKAMAEALVSMGVNAQYATGECFDKKKKTDAFQSGGAGEWLVNVGLYNYGVDFPDVNCVAIFGAMISKVKYIQSVYRGTRVLPGVIKDWMTPTERVAAIAASDKTELLLLSPFYVSERIHICEIYDMFGMKPPDKRVKNAPDFTKPVEIRDYIAALEKAADKHANKDPRMINPVVFALAIGDKSLAHYVPGTSQESAKPSTAELDWLLAHDISTVDIKNSGQAQQMIARLRQRAELGLAQPKQLTFLKSLTKLDPETQTRVPMFKEETLFLMKATQAGAIIGRQQAKWRNRETHA